MTTEDPDQSVRPLSAGKKPAATASGRGVFVPADAEQVIASPFGLIRLWEEGGQGFIAEVSPDGSFLGPALGFGGTHAASSYATAAVHAVSASGFALTVAWIGSERAGAPGDLLLQSWALERDARGLRLSAANDNPCTVSTGAIEPRLTLVAGDEALLTWVAASTGAVSAQPRAPVADGSSAPLHLGEAAVAYGGPSRRVHVLEIAPLEFAVFWLAANGRTLEATRLSKSPVEPDASPWTTSALDPVPLAAGFSGALQVKLEATTRKTALLTYDMVEAAGRRSVHEHIVPLFQGEPPAQNVPKPLPLDLAAFSDLGLLWASQDMLQLDPSALEPPSTASEGLSLASLSTIAEEPLVIDPVAHGAGPDVVVTAVDGAPLDALAPTRVASGWMQARSDGKLTFTPDVDVAGPVRLMLSGVAPGGAGWHRDLDITVQGLYGAASVELRDAVRTIPAQAVIAHNAHVADIGICGDAPTHGVVALTGADADKFVVIGNGLFLRGGTRLEAGRKKLDVAVTFKDGLVGAAIAATLTIAIVDGPDSFLSLGFMGRAEASEIREGQVVAHLGVLDVSGGDRPSLALINNAGGRFALSGGNLVIANPHIIEQDPLTTYDIVVRMAQPNGIALDHKVTLHHEDVAGHAPPPRGTEAATGAQPGHEKAEIAMLAGADGPAAPAPNATPAKPDAEKAAEADGRDAEVAAARGPHPGTDSPDPNDAATGESHAHGASDAPAGGGPHHVLVKGSSSTPDLGAQAGAGRDVGAENLSKLVPVQHASGSDGRSGAARDEQGRDRSGDHDGDHTSGRDKGFAPAWRAFDWADDRWGKGPGSNSGSNSGNKSGSGSDEADKGASLAAGDTLLFKPGFGIETLEHVRLSGGEPHDVLDLSLYGTTFEALRSAGAFAQVGGDVIVTLNPADPAHSDQIVLKSVSLQSIDPSDFKFS